MAEHAEDDELVLIRPQNEGDLVLALGGRRAAAELGEAIASVPESALAALQLGSVAGLSQSMIEGGGQWVRLTSESAAAFEQFAKVPDAAGATLGVLKGGDGKWAHVTRFDRTQVLAPDASLLLGSIAMQATLARMERQLEAIAEQVDVLVEGSKIEVEAKLAASLSVVRRVERLVDDHGEVTDDDWASLASVEHAVKDAYHQTVRWLDPLRTFLEDEKLSLREQVSLLRKSIAVQDVETWLRLFAYAEMTMKRWELLYLLRQMTAAPARLATESAHLREEAGRRHDDLRELLTRISAYLDVDPDEVGRLDRMRLVNRVRLGRLRRQLATVLNVYATALHQAEVELPAYLDSEREEVGTAPLIELEVLQRQLSETAGRALSRTTGAATRTWSRVRRGRGGDDEPIAVETGEEEGPA